MRDQRKNFGVLDREHFVEASGSFPGVGTEVHDCGYDRDQPVILVEAGEIFSGCGGPLLCFSVGCQPCNLW